MCASIERTPRGLNGNGRVNPYEDPNRRVMDRVEDLLSRMTIEEKVGLMSPPASARRSSSRTKAASRSARRSAVPGSPGAKRRS